MRILSVAAQTALRSSPLPLAVLVEMDLLSAPLNLNTTSSTLTIGGTTYLGTLGVGKIDAMADTPAEVKALSFELSGVPAAQIALALTEPVQGRAVRVKLAIYDRATYQVLATDLRWAGVLDTLNISDGQPTATLQVTAEHAGIDLLRPLNALYADAEQQRLVPGDTGLQYMADQVDMRVIWPTADFFKK
jgi:hypothetical protein